MPNICPPPSINKSKPSILDNAPNAAITAAKPAITTAKPATPCAAPANGICEIIAAVTLIVIPNVPTAAAI